MRRAVGPVADFLERRAGVIVHSPVPPAPLVVLRPPGAIEGRAFVDTCQRCGKCVAVCPADAIVPSPASAGFAEGTPMIDADRAACVICDGLQCTHVCPSGALLPLSSPDQISMGLAEVYASTCVRSQGEACTKCVDLCPIGASALEFTDEGPPVVHAAGCTGCGVCQLYCPTTPKAITVRPRR